MRPYGVVDGKTVNIPLLDLELGPEGQNRQSRPLIGLRCKRVGGVVGKPAAHNSDALMRAAFAAEVKRAMFSRKSSDFSYAARTVNRLR